MGKKNKKKESSSGKVVEQKDFSDIKDEKVSAIGRYMKKIRAQEDINNEKSVDKK